MADSDCEGDRIMYTHGRPKRRPYGSKHYQRRRKPGRQKKGWCGVIVLVGLMGMIGSSWTIVEVVV